MTKLTKDFTDFMSVHVNLNKRRYDRLQRGARAVSEYLSQKLPGFQKTERHGSLALRTIIRPVNDREFDVDLLVFVDNVPSKKPDDYIEDVYRSMRDNENYADKVRKKGRCVTVDYAGDFHMDLVPCVKRSGDLYICNRNTNKFEITDGAAFRDWFNRKSKITHGNLKPATRLLKYLRDRKPTFKVSSVLLTALVGMTVQDNEDGSRFRTLPDALKTVTNRINAFLRDNQTKPRIPNPELRREDFSREWDQRRYGNFRNMFANCANRMNRAFEESDHERSLAAWRNLFGGEFGRASP